ncbi:MAG TPA: hypothetical protein VE136_05915 [Anaerolineales bacterium]|nr:hypothetical protein [Anaerolineales bacterium]
MDEGRFKRLLKEIEEQRVPATLDLWPGIQALAQGLPRREARRRRGFKMALGFLLVFLSLGVLLLAISPGLRDAAAQTIREIGAVVGITGDSKGPGAFSPTPSFAVKLPGYLPRGFEYVSAQYNPGVENLPSIRQERVRPGTPIAGPENERDMGKQPSILIRYQGGAGGYFDLFEKKAQPGEELPPGEELFISGADARLQREEEILTLTWIESGTWIELSGRLPEDTLLQIAAKLITTQTPQDEHSRPQAMPDHPAIEATERASFCNPEDYVLDAGNLLGDVPDKMRKGSIRIDLFYEDQYPFPATVAWGSDVENYVDEVFRPALQALKDPASPMKYLHYQAIGMYVNIKGCMEPNPAVRGYFLIEVWDQQVNIGYGGDALELRDLAIRTLEQEMEGLR